MSRNRWLEKNVRTFYVCIMITNILDKFKPTSDMPSIHICYFSYSSSFCKIWVLGTELPYLYTVAHLRVSNMINLVPTNHSKKRNEFQSRDERIYRKMCGVVYKRTNRTFTMVCHQQHLAFNSLKYNFAFVGALKWHSPHKYKYIDKVQLKLSYLHRK